VYVVDTADAMNASLQSVVDGTGGIAIDARVAADVPAALAEALDVALSKPYAWINGPYVAKVGKPIELDASGSYATEGSIASYAWDFDSDGTVDRTTTEPVTEHTWTSPYTGLLTVTVTDTAGRSHVANTHVGITDDGDETPRDEDNCPDVDNQGQEDEDGDGVGDLCDDTPGWPTEDREGVGEVEPLPFDGFRAPVANAPEVNVVNAGRSVPVKFSLDGDRGLDVLGEGQPSVRRIDCATREPMGEPTEATATRELRYDAAEDQYSWVWSTRGTWAGTCRELTVGLVDGSSHPALFRFR
jgi:hypothetical protein